MRKKDDKGRKTKKGVKEKKRWKMEKVENEMEGKDKMASMYGKNNKLKERVK